MLILQPHSPNHPLTFHGVSYSQPFPQNSIFLHKHQPILSKTHKQNPVFITFSSVAQARGYGRAVKFEKRPYWKWKEIYKKILSTPDMDPDSVLNENGKWISKWELCSLVKELRKFGRYQLALQVYEWINERPRYRTTTSDAAIQLDLISKVHGIPSAEQYFLELPEVLKDKKTYGSLMNAYARAKMRKEAESLMDEMRSKDYAKRSLEYNVMMTLYISLKDHAKIEPLITEMKEKKIRLDTCSYNLWLSSCEYQGSDKIEQVFEQMQMDPFANPNWNTFSAMAYVYTKLKQFEKADDCLKKLESLVTAGRRDRMPYHYLISIYATIGKSEEIYRIWNLYKANFVNIQNLGYHTILAALVRVDDVEGAERMYTEWLSVKSIYDARVGNVLLNSYVRLGQSAKAATFFNEMIGSGGKPNSKTWEILAEDHVNNKRFSEALSCLQNALSAEGAKNWKPNPRNVTSFLQVFEQEADVASKDALIEIMKQVGSLDDARYISRISVSGGGTSTRDVSAVDNRSESGGEGEYVHFEELEKSL